MDKREKMMNDIEKYKIETKVEPIAAYFTLILSMLKEPFVSSDAKYLMIQGSYKRLMDLGYSEEDVADFSEKVSAFVKENIEVNSFMG